MKRFFVVFLVLMLALAPMAVNAAPYNYLRGRSWESSGLSCRVTANGLSVTATNLNSSFSTPWIDILPAVKMALGTKNSVTVEISGTLSVIMTSDSAKTSPRLIMRAHINMKDGSTFDSKYKASLNGDKPLFGRNGSNVMTDLGTSCTVSNKSTAKFSTKLTVTRNQVYSQMTPQWYFCFDGFAEAKRGEILALGVQDLTLTVVDGATTIATPKPIVNATPTPTPLPRITPSMTQAPTAAPTKAPATPVPTKKATANPDLAEKFIEQPVIADINKMASSVLEWTVIIIISTGAIAVLTTLLASKKGKK